MPKARSNVRKGVDKDIEVSGSRPRVEYVRRGGRIVLPSPSKYYDMLSDVSVSSEEESDNDVYMDQTDLDAQSSGSSEDSYSSESSDGEEEGVALSVRGRGTRRPRSSSRGRGIGRGRGSAAAAAADESEEQAAWSEDPTPPIRFPFTGQPGLKVPVPSTPLQFFQLFFNRMLLSFVAYETNSYARIKTPALQTVFSHVDIAKFLGVRMFMGIVTVPSEREYWEQGPFGQPTVQCVMSRNRYQQISKHLHCYNRKAVPKNHPDKLIVIRPILEYFQKKCIELYTPEAHLSLDEGMLPYKGRLSMKVYNPMKPDKYGIKIFYLCEASTGFVCDFTIYQGVSSSLRDTVFGLLNRHLHKGYSIFMDNYYNSVNLLEELYANGTHACGTLRLPRGAPKVLQNLKNQRLPRDAYHFRRKGNTFVLCWQDTRLVSIITNIHGPETEVYTHSRRIKRNGKFIHEEIHLNRPVAIRDYTKYMQGVDRLDQKIKYYSFDRRSIKWTKKAFFYYMELMVVNAHILYMKYSTDRRKLSLKEFHKLIITHLLEFDDAEWPPVDEEPIPHAADIPNHAPLFQRLRNVRASDSSPSDPDDAPADDDAPDPDDAPAPSAAAASSTESEDPDEPSAGDSGRKKQFQYPDSKYRLQRYGKGGLRHTPTTMGKLRRRCRVCSKSGIRKDTAYMCPACEGVALCIKSECFDRYHALQRYWTPPTHQKKRGRPSKK